VVRYLTTNGESTLYSRKSPSQVAADTGETDITSKAVSRYRKSSVNRFLECNGDNNFISPPRTMLPERVHEWCKTSCVQYQKYRQDILTIQYCQGGIKGASTIQNCTSIGRISQRIKSPGLPRGGLGITKEKTISHYRWWNFGIDLVVEIDKLTVER
jgi:hypothetical protein